MRWLGPPTTITMKSSPPGNISLLPTGGFSRCWFSAIQPGKLNGSAISLTTDLLEGSRATACISISRCGCGNWCTATVVRVGPVASKNSAHTSL